tara:strand:+ start:16369 stop:17493 length:1125 start_codon:yes stop_codon:yes gene_type:complete
MAQPLEAFQLELETSGESELKTRFNIAELPLTSPQGRERAIDHIIESLNELHEKGIKAEVVIVDGTDTLLSEPNAKAKFLKKMGWRNAHHIPVEDYKNQDLQLSEYRELIDGLDRTYTEQKHLFIEDLDREASKERLVLATVRTLLIGSVVTATLLVPMYDKIFFDELMTALAGVGVGALAGSMSGALQYHFDRVNLFIKHPIKMKGFLPYLDYSKNSNFAEQIGKQFAISFVYLSVLRLAMEATGFVESVAYFTVSTELARTALISMRSTFAFQRIFANWAPAPDDHSPRAERIRTRSRRAAVALSAITTAAEVMLQQGGVAESVGMYTLWAVTGTGVALLIKQEWRHLQGFVFNTLQKYFRGPKQCALVFGG